ncbi:hypothetical protein ACFV1C_00250 [Streptomyces sp. NPDC059605]|uniref:hypothetical protein n=1 Tax=Streptomyces sp. NPDC059605 TaxID=3346882 RepID=UPI0036C5515C
MSSIDPLPSKFEELAEYNTAMYQQHTRPRPDLGGDVIELVLVEPDRSRFTEEHHARMELLQDEFDAWSRDQLESSGFRVVDVPGGGLLGLPW